MKHNLAYQQKHGITETVVTVQFLASLVRNYFGDGEDSGMVLHYATEETPLGTAGSVRNAADELDRWMREHPEAYSKKANVQLSVKQLRDQIASPARNRSRCDLRDFIGIWGGFTIH